MDIDGIYYCSKCMRIMEEEGVCPHCGYDPAVAVRSKVTLEQGTLLNGRYQLGEVIGRGGFGITYAAWDETLGIPVAIKEYFPEEFVTRDTDETDEVTPREEYQREYALGLSRFMRESQVLAMLHEIPGIVKVFDCFPENGTNYIAMEYIHGMPLDEYVREKKLDAQQVPELIRQSVDALTAAHRQGVLHRDISPSNILVQEDGSVKLIDFGAAAQVKRQKEGKDKSIILTEKYAAIEQYESDMSQGPWTDVYCLSATLYTVLTGENPPASVQRTRIDSIVPIEKRGLKLKKHQCRAIMQGLTVQPEKRIRSMDEFRSVLYDLPLPEEIQRHRRLMKRVYTAAAVAAFIVAVLLINFTLGLPLGRGLLYSLRADGFHVVGMYGSTEDVEMPGKRIGLPVTVIEKDVFSDNDNIRKVVVPGSVQTIGEMTFFDCGSLETIYVEPGVREIAAYAFAECGNLHTAQLPDSVCFIDKSAFGGAGYEFCIWSAEDSYAHDFAVANGICCAAAGEYEYKEDNGSVAITGYNGNAVDITVPSYIDGLPVTAFAGDKIDEMFPEDIESITLPYGLRVLPSGLLSAKEKLEHIEPGYSLEVIEDNALEYTAFQEIELPACLKEIGSSAFAWSLVSNVELPDGLESIGEGAFQGTAVSDIVIPDSVTYVGEWAFSYCGDLKSAVLSANMNVIPSLIFYDCYSLTELIIPEGIQEIDPEALANCPSIEYIYLPDSVKYVGQQAFSDCSSLKLIRIPAGVEQLGKVILNGCPNDVVIVGYEGTYGEMLAADMGYEFESAEYDDRLKVDADGTIEAFYDRYGDGTFVFPSVMRNAEGRGIIVEGIAGFHCVGYDTVVLPKYLRHIDSMAFMLSDTVEKIVINEIESIGEMAFTSLHNLSQIDFPEGLTMIGRFAFADCTGLTEIRLPDSVKELGESTFINCSNVTQIVIPSSISILRSGVFAGTGISELTIPGNVNSCGAAFYNCRELINVYVSDGMAIMYGSFYACSKLETVVLPESLKMITRSVFGECTALKDVWIYSMDLEFDAQTEVSVTDVYIKNGSELVYEPYAIETLDDEGMTVFGDCPNVTIHAYPGSTAEAYAAEHGLRFEPITDNAFDRFVR